MRHFDAAACVGKLAAHIRRMEKIKPFPLIDAIFLVEWNTLRENIHHSIATPSIDQKPESSMMNLWVENKISTLKFYTASTPISPLQQKAFEKLKFYCLTQLEHYRINRSPEIHYNTQKVIGIVQEGAYYLPGVSLKDEYDTVKVLPYDMPKHSPSKTHPIFARPAPTIPRHGFVESRLVTSWVELLQLWEETINEDKDGEIILATPLTGEFSAVANNAGVSWGLGNDGATAGKQGTLFIPTSTPIQQWTEQVFYGTDPERSGIKTNVYLELVQNTDRGHAREYSILTQRRDGPEGVATVNFIPRDITIQKILKIASIHGDLLEWEKLIKKEKDTEGVVVSFPGGTLSSHYAVHAIENNIPVITDEKYLYVGQKLIKESDEKYIMNKEDLKSLSKMIIKWLNRDIINAKEERVNENILYTTVGTIHAMSRWDNSPHLMRYRAFSVAMMIRFLTAAIAGELRHWDRHGPGIRPDKDDEENSGRGLEMRIKLKKANKYSNSRHVIWAPYLSPISLNARLRLLNNIYLDFGEDGWDSSYGGDMWQMVTLSASNLVKSTIEFLRHPTAPNWTNVVMAINSALHTAHNNGVAINKWIMGRRLDTIANAPGLGFINPIAARLALSLPLLNQELEEGGDTNVRNIKLKKVA